MAKKSKLRPVKAMNHEPLLQTRKDVLGVLPGRSARYVTDMKRAGLKLPTTRSEVFSFLRRHPAPSRVRNSVRPVRPSCR